MNYEYDDDYECYVCTQDLDEDEMVRFVQGDFRECPYYQVGDGIPGGEEANVRVGRKFR